MSIKRLAKILIGTSPDQSSYDLIHFKSAVLAEISGGARCHSRRKNLFADLYGILGGGKK
jgi:hypothetical protein